MLTLNVTQTQFTHLLLLKTGREQASEVHHQVHPYLNSPTITLITNRNQHKVAEISPQNNQHLIEYVIEFI